jgi:hypothetical protein
LAHIGIRRAEGVDADDLRSEVRKWWDWNDLPDPSDDVLSEIISSGQLLARAERSANRRAVRTGTPIASLGGSA